MLTVLMISKKGKRSNRNGITRKGEEEVKAMLMVVDDVGAV